jgi:catechol 2,3-dioxygenase-like lactoylglutathione lyase family enzyme
VPGVIAGIDHVQIAGPPGCEEEARHFFGGVLGLEELPKPEALAARGGAWFACGGQQLHVGIDAEFAPASRAHPAFAVDGAERLAALAARLGGAGVEVLWDQEVPGSSRFYANDPWGNRLEFTAT